eukprot:TRINITY_DN21459_c0_g1_i2.p1 TRINITY_DN21459_c0_g1~~TRINITY_DN21459_c0_g1_i2.p1  ORF type:complete len:278 (+),score=39.71 TRINITY_DN21459_c0_g1_i2:102-935(+)
MTSTSPKSLALKKLSSGFLKLNESNESKDEHDQEIDERSKTIYSLEEQIESKIALIRHKDNQIEDLQRQLNSDDPIVRKLLLELREQKKQAGILHSENAALQNSVRNLSRRPTRNEREVAISSDSDESSGEEEIALVKQSSAKSSLSQRSTDDPSNDAIYVGWIEKKSKLNNWQSRFARLYDGVLVYYQNEDSEDAAGMIQLFRARLFEEIRQNGTVQPLVFSIRVGSQDFSFKVSNAEEKQRWIAHLRKCMESARVNAYQNSTPAIPNLQCKRQLS